MFNDRAAPGDKGASRTAGFMWPTGRDRESPPPAMLLAEPGQYGNRNEGGKAKANKYITAGKHSHLDDPEENRPDQQRHAGSQRLLSIFQRPSTRTNGRLASNMKVISRAGSASSSNSATLPLALSEDEGDEFMYSHRSRTPTSKSTASARTANKSSSSSVNQLGTGGASKKQHKKKASYCGGSNKGDDSDSDCETSTSTGDKSLLDRLCLLVWRSTCVVGVLLLVNLIVYLWPLDDEIQFEAKVAPFKPRPKFEGTLAIDDKLDRLGERLWEDQFHAPESMAWTADRRAFYTGVEGGFILYVEPFAERWTIAAKLNGRASVVDKSAELTYSDEQTPSAETRIETKDTTRPAATATADSKSPPMAAYCTHDTDLYGARAEFEPSLVRTSRCSRPLGIRLAPDDSRLYVMDSLSGLYRVDLVRNMSLALADSARSLASQNRVTKLIDMARNQGPLDQMPARPERADQLHFGDDIAVDWSGTAQPDGAEAGGDLVYMTDCSRRWTVRYLFWLILENDDTGRVLEFNTATSQLRPLESVVPVRYTRARPPLPAIMLPAAAPLVVMDERRLSFPNGIELTANRSALLISDLNNRRILMHHLRGPQRGQTELLLWVPGYSDNIRRGLDEPDGTPTYWFACGCAVSDDRFEIAEFGNDYPRLKRLLLAWLNLAGSVTRTLGSWLGSTKLRDAGLVLGTAWFKVDPYCTHGLVAQFNENGQILRSLHGLSYGSSFRLLSEAHQVPLPGPPVTAPVGGNSSNSTLVAPSGPYAATSDKSALYLGSVYYSYLGRVELTSATSTSPSIASSATAPSLVT